MNDTYSTDKFILNMNRDPLYTDNTLYTEEIDIRIEKPPEPVFRVNVDAAETFEDLKAIVKMLVDCNGGNTSLWVDKTHIEGMEHLVETPHTAHDPDTIVKLRKKGVKFIDEEAPCQSWNRGLYEAKSPVTGMVDEDIPF